MQAFHVIVHTPEQVREIVAEAHKIALELEEQGAHYTTAFEQACRLLGQRATMFAQPQALPLDLGHLNRGAAA